MEPQLSNPYLQRKTLTSDDMLFEIATSKVRDGNASAEFDDATVSAVLSSLNLSQNNVRNPAQDQ